MCTVSLCYYSNHPSQSDLPVKLLLGNCRLHTDCSVRCTQIVSKLFSPNSISMCTNMMVSYRYLSASFRSGHCWSNNVIVIYCTTQCSNSIHWEYYMGGLFLGMQSALASNRCYLFCAYIQKNSNSCMHDQSLVSFPTHFWSPFLVGTTERFVSSHHHKTHCASVA